MQSFRRKRLSEYGTQLREKQKAKRIFGLLERQFRRNFDLATRKKGSTGENLMTLLECRLDNIVFLGGLAESRNQARQFVRHGHVAVNGKKLTIPSFLVKPDMVVSSGKKDRSRKVIDKNLEVSRREAVPSWLACDPKQAELRMLRLPTAEEYSFPIQSNLIVELLAK